MLAIQGLLIILICHRLRKYSGNEGRTGNTGSETQGVLAGEVSSGTGKVIIWPGLWKIKMASLKLSNVVINCQRVYLRGIIGHIAIDRAGIIWSASPFTLDPGPCPEQLTRKDLLVFWHLFMNKAKSWFCLTLETNYVRLKGKEKPQRTRVS